MNNMNNKTDINYLPKLCTNCGAIYVGEGARSVEDASKEICKQCYHAETHLNKRVVASIGFMRQTEKLRCPACTYNFSDMGPMIVKIIVGLIKVFYIAQKREFKSVRTIGFKCPECSTKSYAMSSAFMDVKEKRMIYIAMRSKNESCPDCSEKMQYLGTSNIQYERTDGALFMKNIRGTVRYQCSCCSKQLVTDV